MKAKYTISVSDGITLGSTLAMIISYRLNQSIGWALFHGFLSWFYVIYQWMLSGKF